MLLSPSSTSVAPAPATTSLSFNLASLSPSVCQSPAGVCLTRTRGSRARTVVSFCTTTTTRPRQLTTPSCLPSKRVASCSCRYFLLWFYVVLYIVVSHPKLCFASTREKVFWHSPSMRDILHVETPSLFIILIPVNILKGSLPFVI
jgi:hypothetical protein